MMPSDMLAGMFAQAILSAPLSSPAQVSFKAKVGGSAVQGQLDTWNAFWDRSLFCRLEYLQLTVTKNGNSTHIKLSKSSAKLVARALLKRYRLCQEFSKSEAKHEQETAALAVIEERLLP